MWRSPQRWQSGVNRVKNAQDFLLHGKTLHFVSLGDCWQDLSPFEAEEENVELVFMGRFCVNV